MAVTVVAGFIGKGSDGNLVSRTFSEDRQSCELGILSHLMGHHAGSMMDWHARLACGGDGTASDLSEIERRVASYTVGIVECRATFQEV